jgi:hypothetical protein
MALPQGAQRRQREQQIAQRPREDQDERAN